MKKLFAVALALGLALGNPAALSAKPGTAKIEITGGKLTRPLTVTNAAVLQHFSVWHGFLGPRAATASAGESEPYEIRFHVQFSEREVRMAYVAFYHPGPAGERGHFYLPRRGERWHDFNARTIQLATGWFQASREWDRLVKPLIEAAEAAQPR